MSGLSSWKEPEDDDAVAARHHRDTGNTGKTPDQNLRGK
jgi:hypothetical protein